MIESTINEFGQPVGRSLDDWLPRPTPESRAFDGGRCRLEPLASEHVGPLFASLGGAEAEDIWTYLQFGPFFDSEEFARHVHRLISDPGLVNFAIIDVASRRLEGMAAYDEISPAAGTIEIGQVVFGRRLQRTTGATEALYLMLSHALDDLGYRRCQWRCDALNGRSLAAAERLGFRYEGTWRNALISKGRSRDTAWFSITDSDWISIGPRIRSWLDPGNFDERGKQNVALSALTRADRTASRPCERSVQTPHDGGGQTASR